MSVSTREQRPSTRESRPGLGRTRAGRLDALLLVGLSVLVIFGVVRPFVAEVFRIPSESMTPTLRVGDRVLVNKLAYSFGEPRRGDLVALQTAGAGPEPVIKRVVALGGDRVGIRDGRLYVNGERQREAYVNYRLTDAMFFGPQSVPPGTVFVLGDNRSNSRDSRNFHAVPEQDLLGRVVARLWPPERASGL